MGGAAVVGGWWSLCGGRWVVGGGWWAVGSVQTLECYTRGHTLTALDEPKAPDVNRPPPQSLGTQSSVTFILGSARRPYLMRYLAPAMPTVQLG